MVDMFIVLLVPAGGDDLQGIKRGVIELADLVLVNKADGELLAAAGRAAADYAHALRMLRPPLADWTPEVRTCSALTGSGIEETWQAVERYRAAVGTAGIRRRRAEQARAWMWSEVSETLTADLRLHPEVRRLVGGLERDVAAGRVTPAAAARQLLQIFLAR
jgi:LAO/AO transport system kinase